MEKNIRNTRSNRSFARRIGRPLGVPAAEAMQQYGKRYLINPDRFPLTPHTKCVVLEIGFGYGEHLLACAAAYPDREYIGAEPYLNGVASVVMEAAAKELQNIQLWSDDVWLLLDQCPDQYFSQVYILFPDPWHKRKHHKRRLISAENLSFLAKKMKENGELIIATDHPEYAAWIEEVLSHSSCFQAGEPQANPLLHPPANQLMTRYHQKNLAQSGKVWQFYAVATADRSAY